MKSIRLDADMVKAVLEGRKTQTRLTIKPQPSKDTAPIEWGRKCPYLPGEVLWVRETWAGLPQFYNLKSEIERYIYKADYDKSEFEETTEEIFDDTAYCAKWKPSIHMPREAARIFLKVKAVRVERLQDISPEDAIAEGIKEFAERHNLVGYWTTAFARFWGSIYTKRGYGWYANPWVWAIEFERKEA